MTIYAENSECNRIQEESMSSFVKGILPAEESRAIQEHISRCAQCAEDYSLVKQLATEVEKPDLALERLLSAERREQALEALLLSETVTGDVESSATTTRGSNRKSKSPLGRIRFNWSAVPDLFKGLIVGQSFALGVCLVVLFGAGTMRYNGEAPDASLPNYTTLTAPSSGQSAVDQAPGVHVFRVMFHPKATEGEIRELIASVSGQITSGPSLSGVYSIAVRGELDREAVLLELRSSPWMEFVEPVLHIGNQL